MREEINADLWLLGFEEEIKQLLLNHFSQKGINARCIEETSQLENSPLTATSSAVFFIQDDVRKTPQSLIASLDKFKTSALAPIIVISEEFEEERENQYFECGVYDYQVLRDSDFTALDKCIKKARIQYQNLLKIQLSALGENEKRYKIIAENSLDLVTIFSPGLFYAYVSPSVKNLLGYEPEELLNKTPFQLFYFEDVEQLPAKSQENITRYHYRIRRKNGDSIWFETCLKPLYDEAGAVSHVFATSKNITKRKRLSSMMNEMQHLARVGGWEYYLEKDKIYATEEIANIFGIPKEENVGFKDALNFFTTTSQKMIKRELGQLMEYGKSWDMELSFYKNNNQIHWVRTVGRAYFMNGKVYKIGGTLQDISERVNYEDLLHKKQGELKAFVENTPAAIAMFDKHMKYIAATNKWCEDYGIKDRNVIGQPHQDIFPKSTSNWKKIYEKCLNGAIEKKEEDKILFPDGKVEWLKWEIRPWYSYKNEIGGLIAMSEIITSRKEAEELTNQQQKRMREIYQITSDITGDISDRIKKVIEKATVALDMDFGILGKISGNSYLIKDCFDAAGLLVPDQKIHNLDGTLCNLTYAENGVLAISDLSNSPYANHSTVSSVRTETYIGVPIWKGGVKYGTLSFSAKDPHKDEFSQADQDFVQLLGQWIGAAIDRRTFERELVVAKEKAEEASKAKAQFVSTMSHEIRTPLNAVVGITHLLLEQDPRNDQIKNLQTLQFSANNLLALINDILDFSKIESGKIEFEDIEYDIKEMLERLHSVLEFKAQEKSIDLTVNVSPSLPDRVKGDPVRLNQILTNLLSNAIKFTDIGGVNLSVDVIESSEKSIKVKFIVTDTGIGIPKEKLKNIFESFTQASSDTSRKYGGTGLGLSISKKLAEMQGGKILVDSTLGKGSVFTVILDMDKVDDASVNIPEPLIEAEEDSFSGALVLLVEDNEVNQMVAAQFLNKKNIGTEVAGNGLIALEKIQSKKYDLILMDLQMPEMDGYEAAQKIRSFSDPYFKTVPIIALTASTMSEVRKKVQEAGMDDYISKPFVPAVFYECVFKHLKTHPKKALATSGDVDNLNIEFSKVMEFAYGERSFYLELLEKMKQEIKSFNTQLHEAVNKKDHEKISFLKHRLSSSLKILGLSRLEDGIEQLRTEILDPSAEPSLIETLLQKIDSHCRLAIDNMKLELEKDWID